MLGLNKNPFWIQEERRARRVDAHLTRWLGRTAPFRLLLEGLLVLAIWSALCVSIQGGASISAMMYAVYLPMAGLNRGFRVLLRERTGGRLEVLCCAPMSANQIRWGLLTQAWRVTLPEWLTWGVVLWSVLFVSGCPGWIAMTIVLMVGILTLLTTMLGLWGASRASAMRPRSAGPIGIALLGYLVAMAIWSWLFAWNGLPCMEPAGLIYWRAANPVVCLSSLFDYGPSLLILPMVLHLFLFAAVFGATTISVRVPATRSTGSAADMTVHYQKPAACRDAFVAVSLNRMRRSHIAANLAIGSFLVLLATVLVRSEALGTVIVILLFLLLGGHRAGNVVDTHVDIGRYDVLISTGMPTGRMFVGQWLAAMLPLWAFLFCFALGGMERIDYGLIDTGLATLSAMFGAALGVAGYYRVHIVFPWQRLST